MRTIDLTGHVLAHDSPLVLESSLDFCTVYIAASSMCLNYPSHADNFFEDLSKKRLIAVFHVQEVQYSSTTSHTACKSQHAAILLTNPTAVFGKVEFKKKLWADCEFTRVRTRSRLPLCVCVVVFGSVSLLFPEARLWKPTRRRRRAHDGTRWENRRPDELIGLRCDIMFPMFWTAFTGRCPTQRGTFLYGPPSQFFVLPFFHSDRRYWEAALLNWQTGLWNGKQIWENK